jgi:ubiquinone/menaquinone biosynthesis C-methylase UbiE
MSSERQLLGTNDPWWGEHVHRYQEVVPYIASNDTVLDLACGTGFGSDILSRHTNGIVIGGDIAIDVIEKCNNTWKRKNLLFEVLNGTKLPYKDAYFDKIVSFETIEHTIHYMEMLEEFFRVLKPGGLLFLSTPNFPVNSPSGEVTNPYHTQEFTYDELERMLYKVFTDIKVKGQKYSRYDNIGVPRFGKIIEWFFAIKGIRKLPYNIKNGISRFFIKKPFFPTPDDYTLIDDEATIFKCKTFFCICRK